MASPSIPNIASQVAQSISSTCYKAQAAGLTTTYWTTNIKTELTHMGRSYGFQVRGAKPYLYAGREWLWDLAWVDIQTNGQITNLPLILECEWWLTWEEILRDFLKLVVARADLRVMIFEQNTKQEVDQCIDRMKDAIKNLSATQIGDRYLFAGWILRQSQVQIEDYVFN